MRIPIRGIDALIANADVFLDTNILLYASNGRFDDPEKHQTATGLLTVPFGTSGQVLAEFYTNAVRKGSEPLSVDRAKEWISLLSRKPCQPVDSDIVQTGVQYSERYDISYWDGAIIAAAERLGAAILYTEDLNHGQTYGSVKAINPFKELIEA